MYVHGVLSSESMDPQSIREEGAMEVIKVKLYIDNGIFFRPV